MVATYKATALGPLIIPPANFTGDPNQVAAALAGITGQLGNWSLRVSGLMNTLLQAGGVITNGMLLIGDTATGKFDLGTLATTGGATITNGAGTITINASGPGLSAPNPGTSGGVVYYNTTTTLASSALLTLNQLVLGGGVGGAPATLGSLGTTATLLHGNAAGIPSFGAVVLTTDVSGTLPVANGGTGRATFPNNSVLLGEGTAGFNSVPGGTLGIPLIGQGAADPAFGTALVLGGGTGNNTLTAHSVLIGETQSPIGQVGPSSTTGAPLCSGGAAADPAFTTQWTFTSTQGTANYNASSTLPAFTGQLQLAAADGNTTRMVLDTAATFSEIFARRSEGTIGTPLATGAGQFIFSLGGRGYTGAAYTIAKVAINFLTKTNTWSSTDQGSQITFQTTPDASTVIATVATFKNEGCSLQGTTTNDSASAGFIGEYASAIILLANEVSINAAANVVTLSLTAGDWNVWGELWIDNSTGGATLSGKTNAWISTTSATAPTTPADATAKASYDSTALTSGTAVIVLPVGPVRVSLGSTTNVFLGGLATVSAGTANGYGILKARRVR